MNKAHPPTFTWSLKDTLDDLETRFPKSSTDPLIIISISEQRLALLEKKQVKKIYTISSAKAGTGNLSGSYKTPLGIHAISQKIGANTKLDTIFKARIDTHKIAKILTEPNQESDADNITSRILWLDGLEEGFNKGGGVDSHDRFIYIHGTDEEGRLGTPVSHGCIRMGNLDIAELFGLVSVGTLVVIVE